MCSIVLRLPWAVGMIKTLISLMVSTGYPISKVFYRKIVTSFINLL